MNLILFFSLIQFLSNDFTNIRWIVNALSLESKQQLQGKVLRVAVFQV